MSNMKKLLEIVTEKATLNEGVNVSINVSGDSAVDVGDVLQRVTNLSQPKPVTPDMMPKEPTPPPMPMIKALDIVGKMDHSAGPAVPPAVAGDDAPPPPPGDMEPHTAPETNGINPMMPEPNDEDIGTGGIMNPPAGQSGGSSMGDVEGEMEVMTPMPDPEEMMDNDEEVVDEVEDEQESKGLTMNSSYKDIHDRLREIDQALSKKHEEFKNIPDPKYSSTEYMTKDLAGGLNKPKTMSKHSYKQGDNPMAMEEAVMSEWEEYKKLDEAGYGNTPSVRSWGSDTLAGGYGRPRTQTATKGKRKGMVTKSAQDSMKRHVADRLGKHKKPNLPEGH
jgi:hypothetical protein